MLLFLLLLLPLQYRMAAEVMTACLVGERVSQSYLETGVTHQLLVCTAREKGDLLVGKGHLSVHARHLRGFYCWHVAERWHTGGWTAVSCVSAVTCLGCLETPMWRKTCKQGWPLVPSPYLEYTGHKESLLCSSRSPYFVIAQAVCWCKWMPPHGFQWHYHPWKQAEVAVLEKACYKKTPKNVPVEFCVVLWCGLLVILREDWYFRPPVCFLDG